MILQIIIIISRLYLFDGQQLVDTKVFDQEIGSADMDENGLRVVVSMEKNGKQCIEVYSLASGMIEYECDAANHELEYHRMYL